MSSLSTYTDPPRPIESTPDRQLLHIVIGGELKDLGGAEFRDLEKVEMVGAYPSYAAAYIA